MKIPKRLRKIINRSGKRPCDICESVEILEEHHIRGRDIPNPNHPSNLANICGSCHNKIHYGYIIIEGWCQTTAGKKLLWHMSGDASFSGRDSQSYLIQSKSSSPLNLDIRS